jgi:hypothetical protein
MLGAQIGDQLGYLLVGKGVGEGRHFLAAIEDLVGYFCRWPELIGADVGESRPFLSASATDAMAVGATLIAKEDGAGLFIGFGV